MADPARGTGIRRPEDSVYYHPTLNPLGAPPAGKPQRYRTSVLALDAPQSLHSAAALPVPKPPPLPQGPAPQLALPAPPSNTAARPSSKSHAEGKLAQLILAAEGLCQLCTTCILCLHVLLYFLLIVMQLLGHRQQHLHNCCITSFRAGSDAVQISGPPAIPLPPPDGPPPGAAGAGNMFCHKLK